MLPVPENETRSVALIFLWFVLGAILFGFFIIIDLPVKSWACQKMCAPRPVLTVGDNGCTCIILPGDR